MISKVKLTRAIKKINPELEVKLDPIRLNGIARGTSGFIYNPANGVTVYVNTEESCADWLKDKSLVRYAKHDKDYRGCKNNFPKNSEIVSYIIKMLNDKSAWTFEVGKHY